MNDYFRAVTLGAFTWRKKERIALLIASMRKAGGLWLAVHFILISICINFPVTFSIARLDPFTFYNRLYGEDYINNLLLSEALDPSLIDENDFNIFIIESGYGANVLLPVLGIMFGLILVIQAVFYLFTAFFLGLTRLNASPLSFLERMGLSVFSSTLPALVCAVIGLVLPTVHIIVFYFIVMFFVFQRSKIESEVSEQL